MSSCSNETVNSSSESHATEEVKSSAIPPAQEGVYQQRIDRMRQTDDFKRVQEQFLQIHKGMTYDEVKAIFGTDGQWGKPDDVRLAMEGTSTFATWVDADGNWKISVGFDKEGADGVATGDNYMNPVDASLLEK